MTEEAAVVADAGPVIHLDELACLDLLCDFRSVRIPESVAEEIAVHRSIEFDQYGISVCPDPTVDPVLMALARTLCLHHGELVALTEVRRAKGTIFLTDDSAARTAASQMGLRVHGSLGVLLRSLRLGRRSKSEVISLLEDFDSRTTLHIRHSLIEEAILAVKKHK